MRLFSDSFAPYALLDERLCFCAPAAEGHARLAGNRSPHLGWDGVPEGTRSFSVICVDPDVPSVGDDVNVEGRTVAVELPRVPFFHWVLIDLPATLRALPEGSQADGVRPGGKPLGAGPLGGVQGLNDYTRWFDGDAQMGGQYAGYDGPCPPWNDERVHGYRFVLLALDVDALGLSGAFTGDQVLTRAEGHVLARAELIGRYTLNPDLR